MKVDIYIIYPMLYYMILFVTVFYITKFTLFYL